MSRSTKTDFSVGSVSSCILRQAIPMIVAQCVLLLYNVVDRIYLGHMDGAGSLALTGVGLTFPIVSIVLAFSALFGAGGVPLFSIARGAGKEERAERIMGTSFALLLAVSAVLTVLGLAFSRPILFAFGASEASFVYANAYLRIYLLGCVFAIVSTGLNGYITAQGFPKIGMCSIVIGALCNIVLDPVFIFLFDMGVAGAALATVISQAIAAVWILSFLFSERAILRLKRKYIRIDRAITAEIAKLGTASFIMQGTNCLVQAAANTTLQAFGGDLYVGVMTVISSVRDIFMMPIMGITNGAQPVIGFNYGAKLYPRVKSGIRFTALTGFSYTAVAWLVVFLAPRFFFSIFSNDAATVQAGIPMLHIYFFGFVFMALQFAGQTAFQALGDAKHAITFSLLRKAVIVVPLTLLLPRLGFGVSGVFLAEPISNVIGGLACYLTMHFSVYKKLPS